MEIRTSNPFASNAKFPPSDKNFFNDDHYGYTCTQCTHSTKWMVKYLTNSYMRDVRVENSKLSCAFEVFKV